MKKLSLFPLLALLLTLGFSSCELIGDVAEGAMWLVVVGIVIGIALVIAVIRKIF